MYKRGFKTWCEKTAVGLRHQQGLLPHEPIDLKLLAKKLGARVIFPADLKNLPKGVLKTLVSPDADDWSAVTVRHNGSIVIVMNPTHAESRQASDLAHELSHLIANHSPAKAEVSDLGLLLTGFDRTQEDEAGWLSGCLLVPREACIYIRNRRMDTLSAAKLFGVSESMVTYRMNMTGIAKFGLVYQP